MCMCARSTLHASTVTPLPVVAGEAVEFATNNVLQGGAISHLAGSTTVTIYKPGIYEVFVNADTTATAAGPIALQLTNNGVNVPGAEASATAAVDTVYNLAFAALVKVPPSCCAVNNTAELQVVVSAAGTLSNSNIVVVKVA